MQFFRIGVGFCVGLCLLQVVSASEPDSSDVRLLEMTDFLVKTITQRIEHVGALADGRVYDHTDASGRTFVYAPGARSLIQKPDLSRASQQFMDNLLEMSVVYAVKDHAIHLRILMKSWTSVQIKPLQDAKRGDLTSLGIPQEVRYAIKMRGEDYFIGAESPRKDHAVRIHSHSVIGNIWLRELQFNQETLKGRVNLGIGGNQISVSAQVKLLAKPKPGEFPLEIKPDLKRSLRENATLLVLAPLLIWFLL